MSDEFEAQAHQVFANLRAVLAETGCGFGDVVKATVYVKEMSDFPVLNRIYGEAFAGHRPARSTVEGRGAAEGRTRRNRSRRATAELSASLS